MTKTKKLLLLAGVFVLLLGAYVAVSLLGSEDAPTPPIDNEPDTKQTYDVFALNANQLVAFSYTHGGVEYAYTLADDAASWSWDGDGTLPISNGQITMMMQAVLKLTSEYRYEDIAQSALPDYGIDEDARWVKFTLSDGTSERLIFGKTNGYNGLVYACVGSDMTTVYMLDPSLPDTFAVLPSDIVDDDKLPTYKKTQFSGFMLEWNGITYTAKYAYPDGEVGADTEKQLTLYIDNGEGKVLDAEVCDALIESLRGWKLRGAATFDPALYAEYGVHDEARSSLSVYYTYTVEYEDENTGTTNSTEMQGVYKLLLGKAIEGKTYVRLSDGLGVYALDLGVLRNTLFIENP